MRRQVAAPAEAQRPLRVCRQRSRPDPAACSYPILAFGTESLRARFAQILREDAEGEVFFALAGTEPGSGSDVLVAADTGSGLSTIAKRVDAGWIIRGTKRFISNGPIASYVVVLCATPDGPTLLVVDAGAEGFSVGTHFDKLGHRLSPVSELHFDDVLVPKDNVVGEVGHGAHIFNTTLAVARPGVAMASVGAARRAFDIVLKYCTERKQGGCRLSEHQHVQARLARVATDLETARTFALTPFILAEETDSPNVQLSIMAKIQCSEMACRIISECMQLLGGNGYMTDYGLEKLYRDIKLNCIYEGENEFLSIVLGRMITQ